MGERLVKGLLIGLIAAAGAYLIQADLRVALLVAAVPVTFALFDLMTRPVFSIFLLFGVGAVMWSCTPLGHFAAETWKKVPTSPRPSPN
jgi:hypothetical protein